MASPVSPLNLATNLYAKLLSERNVMPLVYASDFGYNVIQQIIDITNKAGAVQVFQPKFEIPKMGNTSIAQTLGAAPTLVGTYLRITFSAANSNFIMKQAVYDSNMVGGRVVNVVSPTQVDLMPITVTSWNTSTHFQSGMTAKVGFDISGNFNSRGTQSLQYTPELDFNYTAVTRKSSSQARRDRIATYPKWDGDFWYTSQQFLTLQNFAKEQEFKYFYSTRGIHTTPDEGEAYTTGGIRWNIINNGGNYYPISNDLTSTTFNDIIYDYSMKVAQNGRKVVALMGKAAMWNLNQNVTGQYVLNAGDKNTFGGMKVNGLSVNQYSIGNTSIEYVHWPLLDDPKLFPEISNITGKPKNSSSILLMDMSPVPSSDGSGNIPVIQKRFFGDQEYYHTYENGMIKYEGTKMGDYEVSSSDIDGAQFNILCDDGLYVIPERLGLIELTS